MVRFINYCYYYRKLNILGFRFVVEIKQDIIVNLALEYCDENCHEFFDISLAKWLIKKISKLIDDSKNLIANWIILTGIIPVILSYYFDSKLTSFLLQQFLNSFTVLVLDLQQPVTTTSRNLPCRAFWDSLTLLLNWFHQLCYYLDLDFLYACICAWQICCPPDTGDFQQAGASSVPAGIEIWLYLINVSFPLSLKTERNPYSRVYSDFDPLCFVS